MPLSKAPLQQLARLYGLQTSYLDMEGQSKTAPDESLLAILKALGARLNSAQDAPEAMLEKRLVDWQLPIEPVLVKWEKAGCSVQIRLPAGTLNNSLPACLTLETGSCRKFGIDLAACQLIDSLELVGKHYLSYRWILTEPLPTGYHHLTIEVQGKSWESLLICAPAMAFSPAQRGEKIWGAFLPLYALSSKQSWGAGDYSDLQRLVTWTGERGGRMVGTLPLLPSFIDDQFGPGPYMPAGKLFWNEFYLDVSAAPELASCSEVQSMVNSPDFQNELAALRRARRVDYSRLWRLKRRVLARLAGEFWERAGGPPPEFQKYLQENRTLADYARFRAAGEKQGLDWHLWPARMRDGDLRAGDFATEDERVFLYAQWLVKDQMEALKQKADEQKVKLYLDLPVGVHPYSYDIWRERESFLSGVNGGAPPDPVFTAGQNWNFPPLHPQKIRESGYRYLIASLRQQMRMAGLLRVDHMMGLHRLFCVPEGMENGQGAYLSYQPEELYAILTLESQRHQTGIIGEDLGIVPPEVRPMMEKHGIYRMFVGEYELIAEKGLAQTPTQAVASLNTHDMFPFAAFWEERDIQERQKLQLVQPRGSQKELEERREAKRALLSILEYRHLDNQVSQDTRATLKAWLNVLSASGVYALLVNLEDLWLETRPQNVPGLQRSQNWSRKARYGLEEFSRLPQVLELLSEINQNRKKANIEF